MSAGADVVVGLGACRGTDPAEVRDLVFATLATAGVLPIHVAEVATVDIRTEEPAIRAVAAELACPLRGCSATELAGVGVPHPSELAREALGTPSVAEAAALLRAGHRAGDDQRERAAVLLVPKTKSAPPSGRPSMATCALAAPARSVAP